MPKASLNSKIICHQCGLLVSVGPMGEGSKASCPRCGNVLSSKHRHALDRILYFSISALLCLFYSSLFDFLQMSVQGQERQITLISAVETLFSLREATLGVFMIIIIVGLPTLFAGLLIFLVASIKLNRATRRSIQLLRIVGYVRFWNMCEIFFLGILISMVKIASLAQIELGASFWAYALFNFFLFAAMMHFDEFQLIRAIKAIVAQRERNTPDILGQHYAS